MNEDIKSNSVVVLHYSMALTDGTLVESSFDDEPAEIEMGKMDLPEGMELALYGLSTGDEQTLTLTAEQCFGERDEDNVHTMPSNEFPDELEPEVGLTYAFGTEDGEDVTGTVRSIEGDKVKIDFNHPLAGLEIVFRVKILDVITPEYDYDEEG